MLLVVLLCLAFAQSTLSEESSNPYALNAEDRLTPYGKQGPCGCAGTRNSKGQGALCRDWDNTGVDWCYTSSMCSAATDSAELKGAKWIECGSRCLRRV